MKKINLAMSLFVLLFFTATFSLSAQDAPDNYAGDWKISIIGTPGGDTEMVMHLEKGEDSYKGNISNGTANSETVKIDRVEEKESAIAVYFWAQGYDICLFLESQEDGSLKGNMFDMFDAKGVRIKK